MPELLVTPICAGSDAGPGPRSSHTTVCLGQATLVYGGERVPREPLDDTVHILRPSNGGMAWATSSAGSSPAKRLGHGAAALGGNMYVFGGRGGVEFKSSWNDLHAYDPEKDQWASLSAGVEGLETRSFHAMTATSDSLVVFGGCGEGGRLSDMFTIDPRSAKATPCTASAADIKPRGGAGLQYCAGSEAVYVVFGFGGEELKDVHAYDLRAAKWRSVASAAAEEATSETAPGKRSVFGLSAVNGGSDLLLFGGERDPSDLGHAGAGEFHGDCWIMRGKTETWERVPMAAGSADVSARGWFQMDTGAALPSVEANECVVLHGGLLSSNNRLGDTFALSLQ